MAEHDPARADDVHVPIRAEEALQLEVRAEIHLGPAPVLAPLPAGPLAADGEQAPLRAGPDGVERRPALALRRCTRLECCGSCIVSFCENHLFLRVSQSCSRCHGSQSRLW